MATPPFRRSWPLTIPALRWAGVLAVAMVVGFILVTADSGLFAQLAFTGSELSVRPWAALTYPFVHTGPLPTALELAALLLLAPPFERSAGGGRLLAWFIGGTFAGAALAALWSPTPLTGAGPALLGVAVGSAVRGGEVAAASPFGARGRWLGIALAISSLLPQVGLSRTGILPAVLIAGLVVAGLGVRRARKAAAERRVELPNSHFNPPAVKSEAPTSTPWDLIDLDSLHEVNRTVVEVLLRRARELGPSYLSPTDHELLDRMAAAARLAAEWKRR